MTSPFKVNVFILISSLIALTCNAQHDSLSVKKNQLYIELFGNNYFDPNAGLNISFISINYDRKIIFGKSGFIFSVGLGQVRENKSTDIVYFPTGLMFKPRYTRNGLWFGMFFIPCVGKISYTVPYGNRGQITYSHTTSWQLSPNLTYQYQIKSEKFFCRLSLTPKFLPPFFNKSTMEYGNKWTIVPWGGISIGGGW